MNFCDQQIKERTGHRSLEALHKYKGTSSDQLYEVSMALNPSTNETCKKSDSSLTDLEVDDFKPPVSQKMKTALAASNLQDIFGHSKPENCTTNINIK